MPEFLAFLKTQYNESVQRLAEMTDERIMAADQRPNSKYMPPRNGMKSSGCASSSLALSLPMMNTLTSLFSLIFLILPPLS